MKNKQLPTCPYEIMLCIVDREKGDKVCEILEMNGCTLLLETMGTGTAAKSSKGDFFGFGVIERNIVFALIDKTKTEDVIHILDKLLNLEKPHTGIISIFPISSVTSTLLEHLNIEIKE